jgi:hypothetical protein
MWNILFLQHPPGEGLRVEAIDLLESDDIKFIGEFMNKNIKNRAVVLPPEYEKILRQIFDYVDIYKEEFNIDFLKTCFLYLEVPDNTVTMVLEIVDVSPNKQTSARLNFLNTIINETNWNTWKQLIKQ